MLRKWLFFGLLIFLFSISLVSATTVQLLPNTTNTAWKNDTTNTAWNWVTNTQFTDTEYSQVNVSDTNSFSMSVTCQSTKTAGCTRYKGYKFTFNITPITTGSITGITLFHKGSENEVDHGEADLYWYNVTSSSWVFWSVLWGGGGDTNITLNFTSANASNAVSSGGIITFGVKVAALGIPNHGGSETSSTDFAYVNVTYTTGGDTTPPTWNVNGTNNSNPLPLGQVLFYANWSDNVALDSWIFSWNATGALCNGGFANDSAVAFSGGTWSNVTHQMPLACAGKTIDFLFYANDTSNNWNKTSDIYENEQNTCTYSGSGDWSININDNCTLSSPNTITGNINIYGSNGWLNFQANQFAHAYYYNVSSLGTWYYNSYRWLY